MAPTNPKNSREPALDDNVVPFNINQSGSQPGRHTAVVFAVSMRRTLSRYSILTLPEFSEAMTLGGLIASQRLATLGYPRQQSFQERFNTALDRIDEDMRLYGKDADLEEMIHPQDTVMRAPGVQPEREIVDRQMVEAALSVSLVAEELGRETGLTPDQEIDMFAVSIAMAAYVLIMQEDDIDEIEELFESVRLHVSIAIRRWKGKLPTCMSLTSSDETPA
jgi:hypothetical protein